MKVFKSVSTIAIGFVLLLFTGCDLTTNPYNGKSNEQALETEQSLEAATRGNYQIMVGGGGYYYYAKHLFYINEFPGDNVSLSGTTTDPLFYAYNYDHIKNMGNTQNLWRWGYEIVAGANKVIEAIGDGSSTELDQIKGENLFLRALVHFQLVNVFGQPYALNPGELGVPIVNFTGLDQRPARATVSEVYDFIVSDLKEAASLMNVPKNSSYASKEGAYALLSRVYLNMEENQLAIEYANKVINSGRYNLVDTETFKKYFTLLNENNPETIFAIKHTEEDDHGYGNIGSMYLKGDGGVGWGEMYASESYRNLLNQYENDARHAFIEPQYVRDANGDIVTDDNGNPMLHKRNGYPKYYVNKFSYQQGVVSLSSPVVLRLAEMYLIRAEANAKLGNDAQAIQDVNLIRQRAGLSGGELYTTGDLKGHNSVLDVVLEERRLELAFEGHRKYDLLRNNRPIVRNYPGTHLDPGETTQVIQPSNPRVVFFIPQSEMQLNENLVQNQ
ncbi:MAG: RagB/SusD family nutrient uptake outer membrane protein [Balneolaceae bacterium]|nr:RagB/SusD family nutrient uptake outer membrane protein [Balneolaceae bacterium]